MPYVNIFLIFFAQFHFSITNQDSSYQHNYQVAYNKLDSILKFKPSFKEAVFIVENTYSANSLSKEDFDSMINFYTSITAIWLSNNKLKDYHFSDSSNLNYNYAIYHFLKDTSKAYTSFGIGTINEPFTYDFNDFFGHENWSNMFVSKLIATHKGNCHSIPYLYKILADELGATCWLSLAPNHMYIKNSCKKIGWYNTELTNGEFPIDAWITTSGYIQLKAVQSGIYMDTLSNQQAIALCVLDLAKGYEFQTKNYYDGFIIKCCDLVMQYHPVNVQAMLLKAETLKRIYEKQKTEKKSEATETYTQMEQLYTKMFDLGYREMPEKMYIQWLRSVTEQRNKYGNKQLKETLRGKVE